MKINNLCLFHPSRKKFKFLNISQLIFIFCIFCFRSIISKSANLKFLYFKFEFCDAKNSREKSLKKYKIARIENIVFFIFYTGNKNMANNYKEIWKIF